MTKTPLDDVLAELQRRLAFSHAPYSGVHVAAAVQSRDGRLHYGVNVENAAYPQGVCAEASAISAMVGTGAAVDGGIARVYLASSLPGHIWPCGGCRQKIWEFAEPACEIVSLAADGTPSRETIGDLLPRGFRLERD